MVRPQVSGFAFSEGRLFIYTETEVLLLHPWPELKAVRKQNTKRAWASFIPAFRLLRPRLPLGAPSAADALGPTGFKPNVLDPELARIRAFDAFRYAMPPEVGQLVERFSSRQWRLLRTIQDSHPAQELFARNPAMAFALAHHGSLRLCHNDPRVVARELAHQKQRAILAWLGFPGTDACANILAKIIHPAIQLQTLKSLPPVLWLEDARSLLSHLPRINAGVLALFLNPLLRRTTTPKLLEEVAASAEEDEVPCIAGLINEVLSMRMEYRPDHRLKVFSSVAKVRQVHADTSREYCEWKEAHPNSGDLPPPPLPGTDGIVPLVSSRDLHEEGLQQKNCAGTYTTWVARGEGYLYRVLYPQRATLSIVKGPDDNWQISQLKLAYNQRVSFETQQAVLAWLRRYSLSV